MDLSEDDLLEDKNEQDLSNIIDYSQINNQISGQEVVQLSKELNKWKFKSHQLKNLLDMKKKASDNIDYMQSRTSTSQSNNNLRSTTPCSFLKQVQSTQVFERYNELQQQLNDLNQNLEKEQLAFEQNQIHKRKLKEQNNVINKRIEDAKFLINRAGRQFNALKQFGFMSQQNAKFKQFELNDLKKEYQYKTQRNKHHFQEKLKEFQNMQQQLVLRQSDKELNELNQQKFKFQKFQKQQNIMKQEILQKQFENEEKQREQAVEYFRIRFSKIMKIINKDDILQEVDPDLIISKHEESIFTTRSLEARYEEMSKEALAYKIQIEQLKQQVSTLQLEAELFKNINPQEYVEKTASTFNQARIKLQHQMDQWNLPQVVQKMETLICSCYMFILSTVSKINKSILALGDKSFHDLSVWQTIDKSIYLERELQKWLILVDWNKQQQSVQNEEESIPEQQIYNYFLDQFPGFTKEAHFLTEKLKNDYFLKPSILKLIQVSKNYENVLDSLVDLYLESEKSQKIKFLTAFETFRLQVTKLFESCQKKNKIIVKADLITPLRIPELDKEHKKLLARKLGHISDTKDTKYIKTITMFNGDFSKKKNQKLIADDSVLIDQFENQQIHTQRKMLKQENSKNEEPKKINMPSRHKQNTKTGLILEEIKNLESGFQKLKERHQSNIREKSSFRIRKERSVSSIRTSRQQTLGLQTNENFEKENIQSINQLFTEGSPQFAKTPNKLFLSPKLVYTNHRRIFSENKITSK